MSGPARATRSVHFLPGTWPGEGVGKRQRPEVEGSCK